MSSDIIEKYLIHNSKAFDSGQIDTLDTGASLSIYEVIRVIDGVPLFLEKHLDRMKASAKLLGYSIDTVFEDMKKSIFELIKINGYPEKNIRIVGYNLEKAMPDYTMYYIKSSYPSEADYQKGVPAILYHAERKNPNAKVINTSFKENVAKAMEETKSYEALLVNENGRLTEGSRSNLFLVKGDKVYTAPADMVLVGITRVYVFEACRRCGIEVVEEPVKASELSTFDGMFLSGTSPKVLPICSVDSRPYGSASNPRIVNIMKAYNEILEEYIKSKK